MAQIVWLLEETVIAIHSRQISEHGGGEAYAFGIARDHPFVDGNKRTSLVAARTFLIVNCVDLDATQDEKYLTFLELAEGLLLRRS